MMSPFRTDNIIISINLNNRWNWTWIYKWCRPFEKTTSFLFTISKQAKIESKNKKNVPHPTDNIKWMMIRKVNINFCFRFWIDGKLKSKNKNDVARWNRQYHIYDVVRYKRQHHFSFRFRKSKNLIRSTKMMSPVQTDNIIVKNTLEQKKIW
jgi:hypothetical protein